MLFTVPMFLTGFIPDKRSKSHHRKAHRFTTRRTHLEPKMSYTQDVNFHRYMSSTRVAANRDSPSPHRCLSPQRLMSCPDGRRIETRFIKSSSTPSLDSIVSSSEYSNNDVQLTSSGSSSSDSSTSNLKERGDDSLLSSSEHQIQFDDQSELTEQQDASSADLSLSNINNNNNHAHRHNHHHGKRNHHHRHQKTIKTVSESSAAANSSSSLWFNFLLPSYRSRLSQFQVTFMNIPTTEKLVDDFMCALNRDILLQGRLYLSVHYIAFYSNILGYETCVTVHYREIEQITKATTIKLFPNAIEILTKSGEKYFFTSFVSRERAFKEMNALWLNATSDRAEDRVAWDEICRIIRECYDTTSIGKLEELEHSDLNSDLLKGKTTRKRMQQKKDAQRERLSHTELRRKRSDSTCTFVSCTGVDDEYDGVHFEDSVTDMTNPFDELTGGGGAHYKHLSLRSIYRRCRYKSAQTVRSVRNYYRSIHESALVATVMAMVIVVLLLQFAIYSWMGSIDARLERSQQLIADIVQQLAATGRITDSLHSAALASDCPHDPGTTMMN